MSWVVHCRKRSDGFRYRVFSTVTMDYMHERLFYSEAAVAWELSCMEARERGESRNVAERMTDWLKHARFATVHGNSEYWGMDTDACVDGCRCYRHRIPNELSRPWW